jgi:hypothetical protein
MKMLSLFTCGHLALVLAAAPAVTARADESTALAERELDVLAALINHGVAADTAIIILSDHTTGDPAALGADAETASAIVTQLGIPRATLDDWTLRNAAPRLIDQPLNLNVSYRLLSESTLSEIFKGVEPQQGWSQFFERYGGAPGILRVSRAGFDDSLSHALVYIEHQCGAECGAGRLVHLERAGDAWSVQAGALVWMTE